MYFTGSLWVMVGFRRLQRRLANGTSVSTVSVKGMVLVAPSEEESISVVKPKAIVSAVAVLLEQRREPLEGLGLRRLAQGEAVVLDGLGRRREELVHRAVHEYRVGREARVREIARERQHRADHCGDLPVRPEATAGLTDHVSDRDGVRAILRRARR
jgi:hypothetical protein